MKNNKITNLLDNLEHIIESHEDMEETYKRAAIVLHSAMLKLDANDFNSAYVSGVVYNLGELIHHYYDTSIRHAEDTNESMTNPECEKEPMPVRDFEQALVNLLEEHAEGEYNKIKLSIDGSYFYMLDKVNESGKASCVTFKVIDNDIYLNADVTFHLSDDNFVGSKANKITLDTASIIIQTFKGKNK